MAIDVIREPWISSIPTRQWPTLVDSIGLQSLMVHELIILGGNSWHALFK